MFCLHTNATAQRGSSGVRRCTGKTQHWCGSRLRLHPDARPLALGSPLLFKAQKRHPAQASADLGRGATAEGWQRDTDGVGRKCPVSVRSLARSPGARLRTLLGVGSALGGGDGFPEEPPRPPFHLLLLCLTQPPGKGRLRSGGPRAEARARLGGRAKGGRQAGAQRGRCHRASGPAALQAGANGRGGGGGGIGSRRRRGPRGACAAHGRFWVNSLPRPGPRGSAAREEPPGAADSASRRRAPAAGTPRPPHPPPPRAPGYLRAPPWLPSPAVCTPRSRRGRWRSRPRS